MHPVFWFSRRFLSGHDRDIPETPFAKVHVVDSSNRRCPDGRVKKHRSDRKDISALGKSHTRSVLPHNEKFPTTLELSRLLLELYQCLTDNAWYCLFLWLYCKGTNMHARWLQYLLLHRRYTYYCYYCCCYCYKFNCSSNMTSNSSSSSSSSRTTIATEL